MSPSIKIQAHAPVGLKWIFSRQNSTEKESPSATNTLRLLLIALFALLTPVRAADPHLPEVDALVEPVVGADAPGVAVLVSENGEVRHLRAYGVADMETKTPVTPDTLFDLASVSKQMTALVAAMLVEDGTLGLDTAVGSIIESFDVPDKHRPVTVGDLVYHLGGLPDYWNELEGFNENTDNDAVVEWLSSMPLRRAPGTRYEYSNSGYVLLASTLAAAAGTDDLHSLLKSRVWQPLGMSSTGLVTPPAGIPAGSVARGYKGSDGEFEVSVHPSVLQGDGSVLSSIRDLARYEAALADGSLLEDTDQLFVNGKYDNGRPIDDGEGSKAGYGYGWSIYQRNGERHAGHAGSWMGTAAYYHRNLDTGLSVIVLANGEDLDTQSLAEAIADSVP